MIVNPELGAYRSHYTHFGHAEALFFLFDSLPGYKSTPQTFTDYFTQNFSTYTRVYTLVNQPLQETTSSGKVSTSELSDGFPDSSHRFFETSGILCSS